MYVKRGLLVVSIEFLAVGIDFRWREIALLAAALGPLAYLAEALGLVNQNETNITFLSLPLKSMPITSIR